MYEAPPHLSVDGSDDRELSCVHWLWIVATSLGALALVGAIMQHDLADLGGQPAPRPVGLPIGSSLALGALTLLLVSGRAGIATHYRHAPLRSIRFWVLLGFWGLVGSMSILLGVLAAA